ncbi:hypothetical protein FAF44_33210 [Nonomuraea sp. MG754425]|nr:hypothetical protein [Nonomuraea sp. MG754425]
MADTTFPLRGSFIDPMPTPSSQCPRSGKRLPRSSRGNAVPRPKGSIRGIDQRKRHRTGAAGYDEPAVRQEAAVTIAAVNEWL